MPALTSEQEYKIVEKFIRKRTRIWTNYTKKLAKRAAENPKRKPHWKESDKLRELESLHLPFGLCHNLKKLPPIPHFIRLLDVHNIGLEECKLSYLTNLKDLRISHNNIQHFEFPPNLEFLDISYNKLDSRPSIGNFPETLRSLNMDNCLAHKLDNLPMKLYYLHCCSNQLKELPISYLHNLITVDASHNNINKLLLSSTVENLQIDNNPPTIIIDGGAKIKYLACSKEQYKRFVITEPYDDNITFEINHCFSEISRLCIVKTSPIQDFNGYKYYNFASLMMKELLIDPTTDLITIPPHAKNNLIAHAIENKEECPITKLSLESNNTTILSCFHLFNTEAITSWLQNNTTCPYCTTKVHII